jgi:hypothetical protein
MWRALGKYLRDARLDRQLRPTDVERAGGPSYKTVQAIEDGQAGNTESLDKYATALGLQLPDIINAVLEARETPLSPEAAYIVKIFNETTIAGRAALLAMANALPPARSDVPGSGGGAAPQAPHQWRPAPPETGRRNEE